MKIFSKFIIIFFITFLAVYAAFLHLGKPLIGIDDANIFFVYAKNLANGHGFVYQIGGERVEGFTSMSWVLICSLFYRISNNPEIHLLIFNFLLISFTFFNFILYIERFFKEINLKSILFSPEGFITILWVIATPIFVNWTILSLMETGLWCFLIINLTILTSSLITGQNHKNLKLLLFSLLICLLVLTRPESIVLGLVFISILFCSIFLKGGKIKKTIFEISIPFVVYIVTLSGLITFRLNYFGYPFPNTYYAKTSPDIIYNLSNGFIYFIKFFLSNSFISVSLAGVLIYMISIIKRVFKNKSNEGIKNIRDKELQFGIPIIILFVGLIIPILWGGDSFTDFRFYQPFWMLMIIPIFYLIYLIKKYYEIKLNVPKLSILFMFFIFVSFYSASQFKYHQKFTVNAQQYRIAEDNRILGADLNELFSNSIKPKIAVIPAGAAALIYDGCIVDLLGLNNTTLAHYESGKKGLKNHAGFNKDVFYKMDIDLVLPSFIKDSTELIEQDMRNKDYKFLIEILDGIIFDDQFNNEFIPVVIYKANLNKYLFAYVKRNYISDLINSGFTVKTKM